MTAKSRDNHHFWKGDDVSENGGRCRARRWYPTTVPCQRCNSESSERHHVDGNTANNSPENIRFLCRLCHMTEDGRIDKMKMWRSLVQNPGPKSRFSKEDVGTMLQMSESGMKQQQIADHFNTIQPWISKILRKHREGRIAP